MHRRNFDDDDGGEGRASPAAGLQHRAPVPTLVVHRFAAVNGLISQNFKLLNLFILAQMSKGFSTPPHPIQRKNEGAEQQIVTLCETSRSNAHCEAFLAFRKPLARL